MHLRDTALKDRHCRTHIWHCFKRPIWRKSRTSASRGSKGLLFWQSAPFSPQPLTSPRTREIPMLFPHMISLDQSPVRVTPLGEQENDCCLCFTDRETEAQRTQVASSYQMGVPISTFATSWHHPAPALGLNARQGAWKKPVCSLRPHIDAERVLTIMTGTPAPRCSNAPPHPEEMLCQRLRSECKSWRCEECRSHIQSERYVFSK